LRERERQTYRSRFPKNRFVGNMLIVVETPKLFSPSVN
jgi:hypothetical protein